MAITDYFVDAGPNGEPAVDYDSFFVGLEEDGIVPEAHLDELTRPQLSLLADAVTLDTGRTTDTAANGAVIINDAAHHSDHVDRNGTNIVTSLDRFVDRHPNWTVGHLVVDEVAPRLIHDVGRR